MQFTLSVKGNSQDQVAQPGPSDQQPQSATAQAQNAQALPPGQEPPKDAAHQNVAALCKKFIDDLKAAGHTVESADLTGGEAQAQNLITPQTPQEQATQQQQQAAPNAPPKPQPAPPQPGQKNAQPAPQTPPPAQPQPNAPKK